MKKFLALFILSAVLMVPFKARAGRTLMSNKKGDYFCCCPGTLECSSSNDDCIECIDEYDNDIP